VIRRTRPPGPLGGVSAVLLVVGGVLLASDAWSRVSRWIVGLAVLGCSVVFGIWADRAKDEGDGPTAGKD
jgi:hypothetical protein